MRPLAELEAAKGTLERPRGMLPTFPVLNTSEWEAHSDDLAIDGLFDAHREARIAYRNISEFNDATFGAPFQVQETLQAVRAAINELEAASHAVA